MDWKLWKYFETGPWFNTEKYPEWVMWVFMAGCVAWLIAYALMFVHARKTKTMDYPYVGQASSFAWEFWFGLGIVRVTDMGLFFQVLYLLWFVFDCFLVVMTWKYGMKQEVTASAKKSFHAKFVGSFIFWLAVWYPFMMVFDDPVGCFSGWVCNNVISTLFVFQKLKQPGWGRNRLVAICKFLGTLFCSIVVWTHYSSNTTLAVLAVTFALWDIVYIYLVFKGPKVGDPDPEPELAFSGT